MAETFVPPTSSNIGAITYDPDVENLTVEFQSGDTYLYYNVPVSVYRAWIAQGGNGRYFYANIRNRYSYEQQ